MFRGAGERLDVDHLDLDHLDLDHLDLDHLDLDHLDLDHLDLDHLGAKILERGACVEVRESLPPCALLGPRRAVRGLLFVLSTSVTDPEDTARTIRCSSCISNHTDHLWNK